MLISPLDEPDLLSAGAGAVDCWGRGVTKPLGLSNDSFGFLALDPSLAPLVEPLDSLSEVPPGAVVVFVVVLTFPFGSRVVVPLLDLSAS